MRAIMNIDMKGLTLAQVLDAMHTAGMAYGRYSRHWVDMPLPEWDGQGWDTLAIEAALQDGHGKVMVDQLARLLGQNCIAMYDLHSLSGSLVGPDTSKYQPFDAGLFRVV